MKRRHVLAAILILSGTQSYSTTAAQKSSPEAPAIEALTDRSLASSEPVGSARRGPLTEAERAMAEIAWDYFENNVQERTGLANASDNYPSATLWDIGSYIAAIISANGLDLINRTEAEARLEPLLTSLERLQLFRDECPNKVYNTQTLRQVDYRNNPGEIGCSAIDIGRLMIWLKAAQQRFPGTTGSVERILTSWNFCRIVQEPGVLFGAAVGQQGESLYLQEGRLGYEEYAALGFRIWGFDVDEALDPEPLGSVWLYGVEIPFDRRDPRVLGAHNYVVTESYALIGTEFGWNEVNQIAGPEIGDWIFRAAQNIYKAQVRRHQSTGIVTARTEHQLAEAPYFVYDTIFSNGRPWATITERGEFSPQNAAVASKGALGLWALWDTDYTTLLFDHVAPHFAPGRGYYEGIFEDGRGPIPALTANNNGIILSTLLFKVQGPLLQDAGSVDASWTGNVPEDWVQSRCLPRE
ncbi:MAG TPA: DUF3131 domain-containing protein [Thermoanaerobaculia bacterium]|nr:DUF3131 domain-containing protein [Thermoanaerobaculia bacterium]